MNRMRNPRCDSFSGAPRAALPSCSRAAGARSAERNTGASGNSSQRIQVAGCFARAARSGDVARTTMSRRARRESASSRRCASALSGPSSSAARASARACRVGSTVGGGPQASADCTALASLRRCASSPASTTRSAAPGASGQRTSSAPAGSHTRSTRAGSDVGMWGIVRALARAGATSNVIAGAFRGGRKGVPRDGETLRPAPPALSARAHRPPPRS
jgi:hypothetical protein